jgi:hypothetical protein
MQLAVALARNAVLEKMRSGIICLFLSLSPIIGAFSFPLLFRGRSWSSIVTSFQLDLACLTSNKVFI